MNFSQCKKKARRESRSHSILSRFVALFLVLLIQKQQCHSCAFFFGKTLKKNRFRISGFYLAELCFLYGRYAKAKVYLIEYIEKCNNPDAIYLLSKIYVIENEKDKAWKVLARTLGTSKRLKTWLMLANLVDSPSYYEKYNTLYEEYKVKFIDSKNTLDNYLIIAASRSGNYEVAKDILQKRIINTQNSQTKKIEKREFLATDAEIALKDIKDILSSHDIQVFLVSGTFLGCIREGKILGHDQDVDVGVWNTHTYEELANIIQTSGRFILHEPLSKNIVKAKHLNGILVDVFIHYQEGGRVYHEGVKTRWVNTPFELVEYNFLRSTYLGAKDYDTYLSENYGDWKIPNKDFDYVLDTPNMEIINKEEYILHLYRLLLRPYAINNSTKILTALSEQGEAGFVENYKRFRMY